MGNLPTITLLLSTSPLHNPRPYSYLLQPSNPQIHENDPPSQQHHHPYVYDQFDSNTFESDLPLQPNFSKQDSIESLGLVRSCLSNSHHTTSFSIFDREASGGLEWSNSLAMHFHLMECFEFDAAMNSSFTPPSSLYLATKILLLFIDLKGWYHGPHMSLVFDAIQYLGVRFTVSSKSTAKLWLFLAGYQTDYQAGPACAGLPSPRLWLGSQCLRVHPRYIGTVW